MAQVDTSSFEKIYNLQYYGSTSRMDALLNQQSETTLASWQQNGTNRCEYNSENHIGAYSGFNIPSGRFISYIHLYVTRYSGQNKTLIVTVQYKDAVGEWHDVQDIEVSTTIPYPSNVETVNIGQLAYGIRWIHYKQPEKSPSNNIFFNGLTLYEPDAPSYTVNYNANGGAGSMSAQNIYVDIPTALSPNTFTQTGHDFVGWGTSPNSGVVYSDEQVVTNLAPENESITLYAMWDLSQLKITLYQNESEKNKIGKTLTQVLQVSGRLRAETSIIDPVILIQCALPQVALVNYMYIPAFERYYFVTNITSVRTDLVQFEAHCDVLESFKDYILSNEAIIKRQTSLYNLYQTDNKVPFKDPPYLQILPFPEGFEGFSYVLYIAGGGSGTVDDIWIVESVYNSQYDTTDPEIGAGSTGITFDVGDKGYYIGTEGFIEEFTGSGAGVYLREIYNDTTEYVGEDGVSHQLYISPVSSVQACRNGGLVKVVSGGMESLAIFSNSIDGDPYQLVRNDLSGYPYETWKTISLPNEIKYIRFEYSKLVT